MSDLATYRSALTKSALVGTRHSPPSLTPPFDVFGEASPERQILSGAALLGLTQTAGRLIPSAVAPLPPVARPETRPYISSAAAWRAAEVFQNRPALLPEWFSAVDKNGKIIPPVLLPDALEFARRHKSYRSVILSISGERGRWLAQLNPEWSPMVAPQDRDTQTVWQTGTRDERLALWRELLEEDGTAARAMLLASWESEDPKDRAEFIKILEPHVLPEDESLLESSLDSKLKDVRDAARAALINLPGSALVDRLFQTTLQFLHWNGRELEVTLPENYEKSWRREGILEKPPSYGAKVGERAFWMSQFVEAVPPSRWTELWGVSPEILVPAVPEEWRGVLSDAWKAAARRTKDQTWAAYFVQWMFTERLLPDLKLLFVLPPTEAESFGRRYLTAGLDSWSSFQRLSFPITETSLSFGNLEFSRAVLDAFRRIGEVAPVQLVPFLRAYIPGLSARLHPDLWEEAAQNWPQVVEAQAHWPNLIADLQDRLRFRHEMLKELES